MIRRIFAASSLAIIAACQPASDTTNAVAPEPTTDTDVPTVELPLPVASNTSADIDAEDLRQRIRILADDAFEGRGPAGEKGELSADWIAAELDRVGAEPAGENGSWFQTVGMVEQTLDENASSVSFAGGASGETLSAKLREDVVLWTKKQDRDEASWTDSELVFVGYGVVAPEYGWDDYAGLDVEGKTVVMLVNDPGYARGDELFKGNAMTYYGRWTYKFEEAGRQGATGAIVIHETDPASYGWDVVANSWSGAQADLVRSDGGDNRTLFESWISVEMAQTLFEEAGLDFEALKEAAKTEGFAPVDMGELTTSGSFVQSITTTESRNVVGILPGTTAPDEYMLFTAHWDHLGKKPDEREGEQHWKLYDIAINAPDFSTDEDAFVEGTPYARHYDLSEEPLEYYLDRIEL